MHCPRLASLLLVLAPIQSHAGMTVLRAWEETEIKACVWTMADAYDNGTVCHTITPLFGLPSAGSVTSSVTDPHASQLKATASFSQTSELRQTVEGAFSEFLISSTGQGTTVFHGPAPCSLSNCDTAEATCNTFTYLDFDLDYDGATVEADIQWNAQVAVDGQYSFSDGISNRDTGNGVPKTNLPAGKYRWKLSFYTRAYYTYNCSVDLHCSFHLKPVEGGPSPSNPYKNVPCFSDNTPGSASVDGDLEPGEYVWDTLHGINSGFGDVIGSGSGFLMDSSQDGLLNIGIDSANGIGVPAATNGIRNVVVIYIDSVSGGVASTGNLTDVTDSGRAAVSGKGTGGGTADLVFGFGFRPDYAITIERDENGTPFSAVYQINGDDTLTYLATNVIAVNGGHTELELPLNLIGVSPGGAFKFLATLINATNGYRSNEFVGVAPPQFQSGNVGVNSALLNGDDYACFATVPFISPIPVFTGGNLILQIVQPSNLSGITYHGEFKFDLNAVNWEEVGESGTPPNHVFSKAIGNSHQGFMRLRLTRP